MIRRSIVGAVVLVTVGGLGLMGACKTTGSPPGDEHAEVFKNSAQWRAGKFRNVLPRHDGPWNKMLWEWLFGGSKFRTPTEELPVVEKKGGAFDVPPESGLRITWLGHSTFFVELDGHHILVDPVWGERASPVSWAGPKRWYSPPIELAELPKIEAVLISHDHYDHLDYPTIVALAQTDVRFYVPLGVGAHLAYWGVPVERITELDWWGEAKVGDLTLAAVPARHFSGRSVVMADADMTLWAGWVMKTDAHRVFYSGDTAMFPGFEEIGRRHGPFDVALIETGAYDPMWADVHLGPEQAVVAAQMVRAKLFMPVHWGAFDLALHSWTEPVERALAAAERLQVPIAVPQPGQSVEPSDPPDVARWWPKTEWVPGEERLVMSSGLEPALAARIRQAHGMSTSEHAAQKALAPARVATAD